MEQVCAAQGNCMIYGWQWSPAAWQPEEELAAPSLMPGACTPASLRAAEQNPAHALAVPAAHRRAREGQSVSATTSRGPHCPYWHRASSALHTGRSQCIFSVLACTQHGAS